MKDYFLIIDIPEYMTRVTLSNKRRAKYYKEDDKKLPLRFASDKYSTNKRGFIVDANGKRIVKNKRTVGKPKYEKITGNTISNGYFSPHVRAKMARELKEFYFERFDEMNLQPIDPSMFPIRVDWEVHVHISIANFDLSNFWVHLKYFEDALVNYGTIPDDSIQYITKPGAPELYPVEKPEDRRFVFKFYRETRPEILNNPIWK